MKMKRCEKFYQV